MNHPGANRINLQSLEEVFLRAVEIASSEERLDFVRQHCGEDNELRTKLEKMLNAHFGEDALLDANDRRFHLATD